MQQNEVNSFYSLQAVYLQAASCHGCRCQSSSLSDMISDCEQSFECVGGLSLNVVKKPEGTGTRYPVQPMYVVYRFLPSAGYRFLPSGYRFLPGGYRYTMANTASLQLLSNQIWSVFRYGSN